MLSDVELGALVAAEAAGTVGAFDAREETAGVAWALKRAPGVDVLVFRGSVTLEDWWRDLTSEAGRSLRGYPQLGLVPLGFGEGVVEAYHAAAVLLRPDVPLALPAHSLGCAHAAALAGLHVAHGRPVGRLLLLAPPRPGTAALAGLLAGVPTRQLRNRGDPVPGVPVPVPGLWPWRHLAAPFDAIDEAPAADDPDLVFRAHHLPLYLAGLAKLDALPAPAAAV